VPFGQEKQLREKSMEKSSSSTKPVCESSPSWRVFSGCHGDSVGDVDRTQYRQSTAGAIVGGVIRPPPPPLKPHVPPLPRNKPTELEDTSRKK
jgi:hypothetical protein